MGGDTLRESKFLVSDRLETFDCVIAYPPSNAQADKIYSICQTQKQQGPSAEEIEGVARWVPLSEVEENDFNLNIARYVQKPLEEETITVEETLTIFSKNLLP